MKAVVAAFNKEKGEGPSRGLLCDYEPSDGTFGSTSLHDHLYGEHAAEQGVARTQDASLPRPGNPLVNINTGKTFPTLTKVGWWVSPQLK